MRILIILLTVFASSSLKANEELGQGFASLIYNGDILEIPIKTGVETRIVTGFEAKIGYSPAVAIYGVQTKLLPSGIFITSEKPLESVYAEIESTDDERLIPVRFVPNDDVENAPTKYRIIDKTIKVAEVEEPIDEKKKYRAVVRNVLGGNQNQSKSGNTIVDLVRHAGTDLFGAPRHRLQLNGVQRVATSKDRYRLLPGGKLKTKVVKSYSYKGLFVTTIEVKNISRNKELIDPRKLIGHWLYAGIHDSNSLGGGERGFMYLVSSVPFDQAIKKVVNWRKLNG